VWFDDYADVPGGHVRPEDRATLKAVIGVPIWWRGRIVGSCVVFSRDPERVFIAEDADLLELFAKHAAVAITNARLHEEAERNARAEAAAAERNRMAREVHDTVAQSLVSILLQLQVARSGLDEGDPVTTLDGLEEARIAAEAAFDETRRSVLGLAPSPLEGRTLEEALELEIAWANRTNVADVRLVTAGAPSELPGECALTLFRIAQEALTNALRHAGARSVRLGIAYGPEGATLLVQDDGTGFDPAEVEQRSSLLHLGLTGMTERASILGGTLEVESMPGWGTRVRATIPLERSSDPALGPLGVLVVDDHPMTRAGIVRLLNGSNDGIRVIGEADTAARAASLWRSLRPDVTLMDLHLPDGGGIEAIARIRGVDPTANIIAITAFTNDELVATAIRAGARGYLGKDVSAADLARAIRTAARGDAVLPMGAVDQLHLHLSGESATTEKLTDRERQVLRLLERGLPDREIARILGISSKTVEKHVSAILRKTGAHNRTHAVALTRDRSSPG
jgi:signal transduction histidine kinase/DNA-binding NarL/FixJ family response regulator